MELLPFVLLLILLPSATATTTAACSSRTFSSNRLFTTCLSLPHLSSSLHWTYDTATSTLRLAFVSAPPKPGGWVAWGINPVAPQMAGTQSLVAYRDSTGSVVARTYNVSSYGSVVEGRILYKVSELSAEEVGGETRIFATVGLPAGMGGKVNHVWQAGPGVDGARLKKHDFGGENLMAKGTLDLSKEGSQVVTGGGGGGGSSKLKKRNIHGVLNAVSWGILLPMGAIIARYLKTFKSADPAWFYLHVSCQVTGYAIGVAGWATGLKLGSESKGIQYTTHRSIGIALFCLATVQVFALFLRPNKDHKWRIFWNAYHLSIGYVVIILAIINVFKGLDILNPAQKWKTAYITVIAVLAGIAALLEVITWVIVLKSKSKGATKPYVRNQNGYGREQPLNV